MSFNVILKGCLFIGEVTADLCVDRHDSGFKPRSVTAPLKRNKTGKGQTMFTHFQRFFYHLIRFHSFSVELVHRMMDLQVQLFTSLSLVRELSDTALVECLADVL